MPFLPPNQQRQSTEGMNYLWTCSKISDVVIRFLTPNFFTECEVLAIWQRFPLIFLNILYAECPPYFYFRFVWPTDLESVPHALTPTAIIPTKFEVDMLIHCWVKSVLCLVIRYVTLWPWRLTLSSCHKWLVTCPTLPPSLKTLRLFVLELSVITSSSGCHWHCVSDFCACAISCDLCVRGKFYPCISNPQPRFVYSLCNFSGSTR